MFRVKKTFVGKFLIFISILFPYLMIPFNDSLRSYMGIKISILIFSSVALIFLSIKEKFKINLVDKLLLLFFVYCNVSFLWGDNNVETFFILNIYILVFLLTYLAARLSLFKFDYSGAFVLTLIFFELTFNFLNVFQENKSINGAYLVGHISAFFLISLHRSKFISLISLISVSLFGGRRFLVMLLPHFLKKIGVLKLSLSLLLFYVLLYFFTVQSFISGNINNYSAGLGYRVFEINLLLENFNNIFDFIFGKGLGSKSFYYEFVSKGEVLHYGIFHNFILTLVFNFGLIGLLFFIIPIIYLFKYSNKNFLKFLVAYLFLMTVDSPKDGHWPLALICASIINMKND
jgi:hypothetical protein